MRASTSVGTNVAAVAQCAVVPMPDPQWGENFIFSDVPAGTYDVVVTLNGNRVIHQITVREGLTSFIELSPPEGSPSPTTTTES